MIHQPIHAPVLGASGRLSLWYVRPGESVYFGDRVVEIVLPGISIDVSAPASGILSDCHHWPGDTISDGQTLGLIQIDPENA
ncbi:MAG: lipoyl domain-containing protein [Gemmataceae bacterium]